MTKKKHFQKKNAKHGKKEGFFFFEYKEMYFFGNNDAGSPNCKQ